jgi:hypothetical protein
MVMIDVVELCALMLRNRIIRKECDQGGEEDESGTGTGGGGEVPPVSGLIQSNIVQTDVSGETSIMNVKSDASVVDMLSRVETDARMVESNACMLDSESSVETDARMMEDDASVVTAVCNVKNDARMSENVHDGNFEITSKPEVEPSKLEPAVKPRSVLLTEKKESKESTQPKLTFDLCNIKGGKYNLKRSDSKSTSKSKSKSKCSDVKVGNTNSSSRMFRGENFNNIPILNTPTKRKIESDTNVTAMSRYFNDLSAIQTGQHEFNGSPAKKRKWGQGGVRSVTSDSSKKQSN